MCISLPCEASVREIKEEASFHLSNRYFENVASKTLQPRICASCDRFATIDNEMKPVELDLFIKCLERCKIKPSALRQHFPNALLEGYKAEEECLKEFFLSPKTRVFESSSGDVVVDVCKHCSGYFAAFSESRAKKFYGPPDAIFNGNITGQPPSILLELNPAELALVTPNRILTQALVLQCDNHDGIVGWHSMFENNVETHISNIQYLIDAGLEAEFICVLCGPWTKIQADKVWRSYRVDSDKVIKAFEWLKKNNIHFKDITIPPKDKLPQPRILHHKSFLEIDGSSSEIENEINVTVLLPDGNHVNETNGVFESQEEFRRFLIENGSAHVKKTFFTKPSKKRCKDYIDDEFVKAFPVQFPFGIGCFGKEKYLRGFTKKRTSNPSFHDRVLHLLRTHQRWFHVPVFNLVANGILMKNDVFSNVRLQCNLRYEESKAMGARYGSMTASALEKSIINSRRHSSLNTDGDRFLNSISAISECLPHSNEAATRAKQDYFSYLVSFGLPALMVTISPDDKRCLWIQVACFRNPTSFDPLNFDADNVDESELKILYRQRCGDRLGYPGICAEEYMATIEVFIRDILQWDVDKCRSTGVGLFGETEAFTVATEEQGRKTLHGHFLVWIKGWNELLHKIMTKEGKARNSAQLKQFVEHCSSSEMFQDFDSKSCFGHLKTFEHEDCRNPRLAESSRFTVNPVSPRVFSEMRQSDGCYEHKGHIADCPNCQKEIMYEDTLENALQGVTRSTNIRYDRYKRRLDNLVFEMQKDRFWFCRSPENQAKRLFLANAITNSHSVYHSKRCFKKGNRCYSDFPIEPVEKSRITYSETSSSWCDFDGRQRQKYLFQVETRRKLEDCYTNTHNRVLTNLFCCNNNVISAMTGAAVLYVTCYSVKKTQKDERQAFENVASVVVDVLKRQEEDQDGIDQFLLQQVGFKRLILAVMIHTNSLVIAAPMAHYIAFNGSRYRFSHERQHIPLRSLSMILRGESVSMHLSIEKTKNNKTKRVPFCSAMNYLLRPDHPDFEKMNPWDFWRNYKVIERSKDKETDTQDIFEFAPSHPKRDKTVLVRRQVPVVPKVDWTFFGDAKSLTYRITEKHKNPTTGDEEHCRRLLLLFSSYRTEKDLTSYVAGKEAWSYAKTFHTLWVTGKLSAYEPYMQNIQNIRNSLDAGTMGDKHLVDTDEVIDDEEENDEDDELNALQSHIASFFNAPVSKTTTEEPTNFVNEFQKDDLLTMAHSTVNNKNSVIEKYNTTKKAATDKISVQFRQQCSPYTLNALIKSSFLLEHEIDTTVICTGSAESIIKFGTQNKLDLGQQHAFEVLCATVILTFVDDSIKGELDNDLIRELHKSREALSDLSRESCRGEKPLRLFLTGPAGAGKSTILSALISYIQQFCTNIGLIYDKNVIRLTALTGAAATEIKGQTTHKECKLSSKSKINEQDIREWLNTRLIVVDEISFGGYTNFLLPLSKNLQILTECHEFLYGRTAIVFIGDFLQLEPVNSGDCIYKVEDSYYWEMSLNLLIELEGKWRFKDCNKLQYAFDIVRDHGFTQEVRDLFNQRVLSEDLVLPDVTNMKIATFTNEKRENFNNTLFMSHLQHFHSVDESKPIPLCTVIIKGFLKWKHNDRAFTFGERAQFFNSATESNTRQQRDKSKRIDPFLKLYDKCEVMVTRNEDVENGIANGTTAKFRKVVLKQNRNPHKIRYNGYWVYAVNAEDVDRIELTWSEGSLFKGTFSISPNTTNCISTIRIPTENGGHKNVEVLVKITQFAITVNAATTGHKLQGKSVDYLFVGEYAKSLRNWLYVVLSRVRSIQNLYLIDSIPTQDSEPDPRMMAMMKKLRETISITDDSSLIKQIRLSSSEDTDINHD